MEQALRELLAVANRAFATAGVRFREREENGQAVAQVYIPSYPRPIVLTARVALPSDVVGGKIGRKVKSVAKKLAKSKVLKKLGKVAIGLAAVIPGGQGIAAAAAAVTMAKKLAKAAKSGNPRQKAAAKLIVKAAKRKVLQAQSAPAVPQGYPNTSAARLPSPVASNGFADDDQDDQAESMDPDMGAPTGEVDMDEDEEITADEDTESADEPE